MSTVMPNTGNSPQKDGSATTTKPNRGGLEGVVAATTALSKLDGTAGRLIYRGYNIHDLARTTTFEEIAYLLWYGHLPNRHYNQREANHRAGYGADGSFPRLPGNL